VDPLFRKYVAFSPYCFAINNPIYFIDPDGRGIFPSKEKLKEQGQKTLNNKSLKQTITQVKTETQKEKRSSTHCSEGVREILNAAEDHSLDNLNANQMGYKLRNEKDFAEEITPEEALKYANMGVTIIASYMKPGYTPEKNSDFASGHVAIVAPGEKLMNTGSGWKDKNEDYAKGLVNLFNVGPIEYHKELNLKEGISGAKAKDSGLYILKADLIKIQAQQNTTTK